MRLHRADPPRGWRKFTGGRVSPMDTICFESAASCELSTTELRAFGTFLLQIVFIRLHGRLRHRCHRGKCTMLDPCELWKEGACLNLHARLSTLFRLWSRHSKGRAEDASVSQSQLCRNVKGLKCRKNAERNSISPERSAKCT